jgi:hypothetical protein
MITDPTAYSIIDQNMKVPYESQYDFSLGGDSDRI